MNVTALLDHLRSAGIRIVRTDSGPGADVLPGADLAAHRDAIAEHQPALLAALELQDRIVRAIAGAWPGAGAGTRWPAHRTTRSEP
jgi:hypothetical protein